MAEICSNTRVLTPTSEYDNSDLTARYLVAAGGDGSPGSRRAFGKYFAGREHLHRQVGHGRRATTGDLALGGVIGLAVAGPVGAIIGAGFAQLLGGDDAEDELAKDIENLRKQQESLLNSFGNLTDAFVERNRLQDYQTNLSESRHRTALLQAEANKFQHTKLLAINEEQNKAIKAIEDNTNIRFDQVDGNIAMIGDRLVDMSALLQDLTGSAAEFAANSTNAIAEIERALQELRVEVNEEELSSSRRRMQLTNSLNYLASAMRDQAVGRQQRNFLSLMYADLALTPSLASLTPFTTVPAVPPNPLEADAAFIVEQFKFAYIHRTHNERLYSIHVHGNTAVEEEVLV